MSSSVAVKAVVAKSTFDYVKQVHGMDAWDRCLTRLSDPDRIAINAGGNVPLDAMGRFNEAFVAEVCGGVKTCAQEEFRKMGAVSAEQLLTGSGIFSIFARFVSPKQVLNRAERVFKTAYPGVTVEVRLDPNEEGGLIRVSDMSGYPYGSQRIVGWLLRGIEIVGGNDAHVREVHWDEGQIDAPTYEFHTRWEGWR